MSFKITSTVVVDASGNVNSTGNIAVDRDMNANGSGVTMDAGHITSGAIADARLPTSAVGPATYSANPTGFAWDAHGRLTSISNCNCNCGNCNCNCQCQCQCACNCACA